MDSHTNFAYSTVLTAPSPGASGTSLVLQSGDGTKFPTPPFNATVWPAQGIPLQSNAEIVRVTGKSTDTLTISRSQESTSARTIGVGDQIAATITVKTITDIENSAVMEDSVTVAATRIVQNMLAAGDAQPAFSILGDGTMQWGPGGTTALDTTLSRSAPGTLTITGTGLLFGGAGPKLYQYSSTILGGGATGVGFRLHMPYAQAAADIQLSGQLEADTTNRWRIAADGTFLVGPGGSTQPDTTFRRNAAGFMALGTTTQKGGLVLFDSAVGNTSLAAYITTEANPRFYLRADGMLNWGSGGATATDTNLYRVSGAAVLATDNPLRIVNAGGVNVVAGSTAVLREYAIITDANPRVQLLTDRLQFGPGGATTLDTQIQRTAASTMQMNGTFIAGGFNAVPASAGAAIRAFVSGDTQNRVQINADAGGGAIYMGSGSVTPVKVLGTRITGWAAWTGTANRATKATSTATVADCAGTLMALIADLTTHGIIGP